MRLRHLIFDLAPRLEPMKIATFNINGVKARIEAVLEWLDTSAPDVALLQEIKIGRAHV